MAGHQFGANLMALFADLVLKAATSQRGAAAVLKIVAPYIPELERVPSANSGRLWLMRLGLYELRRLKEAADDWVWIVDHTVQLGPRKCLVIVGVRLSAWRRKEGPLEHEDLTLLNLTPMEQSTGKAVAAQLQETRERMGIVPAAVLSDEGAELKSGMALFREGSPEVRDVPHVHDIKHKVATILKRELHDDKTWQSFVTRTNRTKLQVTLTQLAFLVPPSLKNKARYMNLDTLVQWGCRVLTYLDDPCDFPGQTVDHKTLQQKLGWLRKYRRSLAAWAELLEVGVRAETYIRRDRLRAHAEQAEPKTAAAAAAKRFIDTWNSMRGVEERRTILKHYIEVVEISFDDPAGKIGKYALRLFPEVRPSDLSPSKNGNGTPIGGSVLTEDRIVCQSEQKAPVDQHV